MAVPHPHEQLKSILQHHGLNASQIETGEIEIRETLPSEKYALLEKNLSQNGFELINDKETILMEKVKMSSSR